MEISNQCSSFIFCTVTLGTAHKTFNSQAELGIISFVFYWSFLQRTLFSFENSSSFLLFVDKINICLDMLPPSLQIFFVFICTLRGLILIQLITESFNRYFQNVFATNKLDQKEEYLQQEHGF